MSIKSLFDIRINNFTEKIIPLERDTHSTASRAPRSYETRWLITFFLQSPTPCAILSLIPVLNTFTFDFLNTILILSFRLGLFARSDLFILSVWSFLMFFIYHLLHIHHIVCSSSGYATSFTLKWKVASIF